MDELDLLRALAEAAEGEPVPPVSVTGAVAERLARRKPAMPLWPFGIGVSVAATAALVAMLGAFSTLSNPFLEFSMRLLTP